MKKIKILTHFAHATYQTALAKVPNTEFYHVIDPDDIWPQDKKPKGVWPENDKPVNIKGISAKDVNPADYDLMIIHWHPFIETFCEKWPTISTIMVEHTWPYYNSPAEVNKWKNICHKYMQYTVFITHSSRNAWDKGGTASSVIYHLIDVDKYPQKMDYSSKSIITTTNEFIKRDWACGFSLWAQVLGVPGKAYFEDISLYGYGNDNIGKVAKGPRTQDEILNLLTKTGVYFNPSQMSPIPMSLLEAAAVGTPIISTAKCEVGRVFKNKEHGIISDDPIELRNGIKYLLDNPDEAKRMAENAKDVVKKLFNPKQFQNNWSKVLERVRR
ncbi:glycosyltransferase family 4 protein [Patescibacteria group bacterium]|nr:glycosyltransferase family 4 protein [Patescibacteria group bacterium]